MPQRQLLVPSRRGISLYYALQKCGLLSGLQFCNDVGDRGSYTSGTKLLDLSGNGQDFDFGAGGAAPTFTGTVGDLTDGTYLAHNGGDSQTYDSANEAWMDTLHKANAHFTLLFGVYLAASANNGLFGGSGNSLVQHGVQFFTNGANGVVFSCRNGSGAAAYTFNLSTTGGLGNYPAGWNITGISINEGAGTGAIILNSGATTIAPAYSSPSANAASFTYQIGALGSGAIPLANGGRYAFGAALNGVSFSVAQFRAVFNLMRPRLGL